MAYSPSLHQREQDKFVETTDNLTAVRTLGFGGLLGGIEYDYVGVTYPSTITEVYTFKTGGSGGTTVATVTLTYTNATKCYLLSVSKA